MSRSIKGPVRPDETDNPGTEKAGARVPPFKRPRSPKQMDMLLQRRRFGSTEKTLRKNAPKWRRAFSKEGRRLDEEVIKEELVEE